MRKYITLLLLMATTTAFSQSTFTDTKKPALQYEDYMKKRKTLKTVGWLLTAAGTGGLIATLSADMNQSLSGAFVTIFSVGTVEPEYKSYTGYYIASGAAIVGGIICFAQATKNKQKAAALQPSFKMETAPVLYSNGMRSKAYPSLSLSISL